MCLNALIQWKNALIKRKNASIQWKNVLNKCIKTSNQWLNVFRNRFGESSKFPEPLHRTQKAPPQYFTIIFLPFLAIDL